MAFKPYNKFKNVKKTTVDGILFDSNEESLFYSVLKKKVTNKEIKSFTMQVPYLLQEGFYWIDKNGKKKKIQDIEYISDFLVVNNDDTETVIDVKSGLTIKEQTFLIKIKMLKNRYRDIDFRIAIRLKGLWIEK